MKKIYFLCLLIFFCISCSVKNTEDSISGIFEGVGDGLLGQIRVRVEIEKDKIKDITVIDYFDTPGYSDAVFEYLPAKIIEENSVEVDCISGATITSKGFLDAVKAALEKADVKKITAD